MSCYAGDVQEKAPSPPQSEFDRELTFEELAKQQGVVPIRDFDSLLGTPVRGDESVEEFQTILREWRREGAGTERP